MRFGRRPVRPSSARPAAAEAAAGLDPSSPAGTAGAADPRSGPRRDGDRDGDGYGGYGSDGGLEAVPPGMRIAGAWSWRILVVAAVFALVVFLIIQLRLIVIPLMVAVVLSALLVPFSNLLQRHKWPKWAAVAVSELGVLVIVGGLLLLVVTQITSGYDELQKQTLESYAALKDWLLTSPLHLTEDQINEYAKQALAAVQQDSQVIVSGALSVGSTVGHVLTGLLLTLFSTLFILIDGRGIWSWVVRLFPRRARAAMDGAGRTGWATLQNFVKVQILVAFVDAVGIGLGAFLCGVPLAIPIAVMVFLGSFVPVIGAVVTGAVAVFVALVYNGPVIALIMLGVVLLVQQLEGHILQPLIMGTAVKVHPLAVVLAVAGGSLLAGIPGAFFAVPVVATVNVMVKYIAQGVWRDPLDSVAAIPSRQTPVPPTSQKGGSTDAQH